MSTSEEFKGKKGLVRLWKATGYSCDGIAAAWKHEAAFHLGRTGIERALMAGSILLILIAEMLNSALEAIVDKASPERHELARRAKDKGSAAVLLSLINAAVVWACVLWPRSR